MTGTGNVIAAALRPGHEAVTVAAGTASVLWCLAAAAILPAALAPAFLASAAASAIGALPAAAAALARRRLGRRIASPGRAWITMDELAGIIRDPSRRDDRWLGWGFPWEQGHTQVVSELLRFDWSSSLSRLAGGTADRCTGLRRRPPLHRSRGGSRRIADRRGYPWIHALGREKSLFQALSDAGGHTLVIGGTGSGKSRVLDCLVVQEIARGGAVIVIDPKGDAELEKHMREACRMFGRAEDFRMLHPARPGESVRINPLRNYSQVTELAARLASVVPSGGDNAAFVRMAERDIRIICRGMKLAGAEPSISSISRWFLDREGFAKRILLRLSGFSGPFTPETLAGHSLEGLKRRCLAIRGPDDAGLLESLCRFGSQNMEFVMKTESVMIEALELLSSGSFARLLSPPGDPRALGGDGAGEGVPTSSTSFHDIVHGGRVAYIGLDALTDPAAAAAAGTLLLADLTAVAGAVYDHAQERARVALFVDEASEVLSETFIQLLNKGRGAGVSIVCATQAVADFSARLGSQASAWRVLANLNNLIALRCTDIETQAYVTARMPKTVVRSMLRSHSVSTSGRSAAARSGSIGERMDEKESELVPPQLVNSLPDCEFLAVVSGGWVFKGRMPILVTDPSGYRLRESP